MGIRKKIPQQHTFPLLHWVPAAVSMALAAGLLFYFFQVLQPQPAPKTAESQAAKERTAEIDRQHAPNEPLARAAYFAGLGQQYEQQGDAPRALNAYLQAQQTVDEHNLTAQVVYYEPIANAYLHQGNMALATDYLQRYRTYLQDRLRAAPDDPAVEAALRNVNIRLSEF